MTQGKELDISVQVESMTEKETERLIKLLAAIVADEIEYRGGSDERN